MTLGTLWDRVNSVVVAQSYVRAATPFDFEQQPDGRLDRCYHCTQLRESTEGYLGGAQNQQHTFTIFLGLRVKRDPWGAYRQLLADMEALESALLDDEDGQEYYIHDDPGPQHELRQPVEGDYVIGQLQFTAEFDRTP